MSFEPPNKDLKLSKGLINLQDRYLGDLMDAKKRQNFSPPIEGKEINYQRSLSQGNSRRLIPASYFSLESLLLLICLTASLLILPLVLPPLPPPPFMLLLLPICILALLMILAFMPSNVRDLTYTYV